MWNENDRIDWLEREKEYQRMLDEKTELIRILHDVVRDLQESGSWKRSYRSESGQDEPGYP